ncbi:MAG: MBL fold metallo-hydrolase [Gemmatimonadetes bacterium]|nr:MBL fold metallo-hydrolase [Gemmatimonadota bacterium]
MRVIRYVIVALVALTATTSAQSQQFETTQIADGVYQFRWQAHNSLFVVHAGQVVVIDPISSDAARQLASEIRRVAPSVNLRAIVYSHDHADHATGARVLREEFGMATPIVAHENALAKVEAVGDADLPPPDITFVERTTLHLGGKEVQLHYLGRSHSDNMVVAFLPDDRIAFAVDFVSNDRVGFRGLPDYHFPEFYETIGRLRLLDFETIVFGHGPPGDRATIDRQIAYYEDLRRAVTEAVGAGLSEDEAAASVRLPRYADWSAYDDWFELNVRAIYQWLAASG